MRTLSPPQPGQADPRPGPAQRHHCPGQYPAGQLPRAARPAGRQHAGGQPRLCHQAGRDHPELPAGRAAGLAYAATRLGQNDLDPAQAQDEASRLRLQTNSFNSSLVVDADGLVIATSPQTLQLQDEILHSAGNNAALAARQPMISDPYQSTTGKLLVSLSHPIFDRQGRYRGYVSGTLYLRQRSALHAAGQALLPRRLVPVRGGPQWPPAVPRRWQAGRRLVVGNPAVKAVVRGERGAQQVRNNLGVSMLAGYAPVPATGWGIIAQRPTEATLQPLSRLMTAVIWNAIPLGLLSLLVTWWFARRISMPLWQLARNVQGGEDTGNAISHVSGIRAWYFEVAQLKQAVLHSFNALQDRIGTLSRANRTDPLTGLLNRRGLRRRWMRCRCRAFRSRSWRWTSIASNRSTTATAMTSVTPPSSISPTRCAATRATATSSAAPAANSCCCCRASAPTRRARLASACASTSPITRSSRSAPSPCHWAWPLPQLPCRCRAGAAAGRQGPVHGQGTGPQPGGGLPVRGLKSGRPGRPLHRAGLSAAPTVSAGAGRAGCHRPCTPPAGRSLPACSTASGLRHGAAWRGPGM